MPYLRCYRPHSFGRAAQETVDRANAIIAEMDAQGYLLTLRQLYYQFVRRNWVENSEREYKRLGRIVTDAREAGLMDWLAIEDRGRAPHGPLVEEDPAAVLSGVELGLQYDRWARQDTYLEVWVEKDALRGVVARPCRGLYVANLACKGYLSASEAWRAGLRFQRAAEAGKRAVLLHLADHDPSGMDMTEDNRTRLRLFAQWPVEVRRLALNMDQIEEYGPPPNPAKVTDSRCRAYVERYGASSWELDALEPSQLDNLLRSTIEAYIDWPTWDAVGEAEREARRPLAALGDNWEQVQELMRGAGLI